MGKNLGIRVSSAERIYLSHPLVVQGDDTRVRLQRFKRFPQLASPNLARHAVGVQTHPPPIPRQTSLHEPATPAESPNLANHARRPMAEEKN